jgi:outer membrane protein assembly factor BamB
VTLLVAGCGADTEGDDGSTADWPLPGRVPSRTHFLPSTSLQPPLREAWGVDTRRSVDFPPAIGDDVAYLINLFGNAVAVGLGEREILWRQVRNPAQGYPRVDATPPLYHDGRVFFALQAGALVASDAVSGETIWTHRYSHVEFSPIAIGETVYAGAEDRNLLALGAADGELRWRYRAPEDLGASPSYHRGRLYLGVGGAIYCLDAGDGRVLWRADTTEATPSQAEVSFHSPAAIAFGRVYAARSDGRLMALDQRSGKAEWSFRAGSIIDASPAAARPAGAPPTIYFGSYDERFYALDARTGEPLWRRDLGGPVLGTATVIGATVYVTRASPPGTVGFDARTGEQVVKLPDIDFPPVSDGQILYAIDGTRLVALQADAR